MSVKQEQHVQSYTLFNLSDLQRTQSGKNSCFFLVRLYYVQRAGLIFERLGEGVGIPNPIYNKAPLQFLV